MCSKSISTVYSGNSRVPELAVVNSSPLIFLSKAGLLDWLHLAAPTVLVPDVVAQEISRRGPADVTAKTLAQTSWLRVVTVPVIPPVIQSWDLGPGESAVLAYAYTHPGSIAILDDGLGRRCTELLGIPLHGTLGLVMMAKKRGLIDAARPVILTLKQHGMYLSDRVIDHALALIGE